MNPLQENAPRLDENTLSKIADFICGDCHDGWDDYHNTLPCDYRDGPVYRKGTELTAFFGRAGLDGFVHDGSSRKKWVQDSLKKCNRQEMVRILFRLSSPREYQGEKDLITEALTKLNKILYVEGFKMTLEGVEPKFERIDIDFSDSDTKPATSTNFDPPPDLKTLGLEKELESLLEKRWVEAEKCIETGAHLASLIIMGSILEGLLLGMMKRDPATANRHPNSPKRKDGKTKAFSDWKLAEMIDVAHGLQWINTDVKQFSHAIREFRNIVHPHQQLTLGVDPDADTVDITWKVIRAAVNDLTKVKEAGETIVSS